jgi:DNA-binding PadR family transcriptional regulator
MRRPSPQTIAVLSALADGSATWNYGYELCRSLGLKAGTVYPILIRLAERGMVETAWETEAPPGRPDLRRKDKAVRPSFTEVTE